MNLVEKGVRRRRVYKGKAVDFWVDTVRLPSGGTATREYLGHPGAVAVVAVMGASPSARGRAKEGGRDPKIVFVRQDRYPVKEVTLEIPAGKLDPRETPLACVRRELEEETGFRARRFTKLLSYWPTPAFADEVIHIYKASDLAPGAFRPDEDEFLEPIVLPLSRVMEMIRRGRIQDSKTLIALLAFDRWHHR